MPVIVAAMALIVVGWLNADGVPAAPTQLDESLLTITETSPVPTAPDGTGDDTASRPADDIRPRSRPPLRRTRRPAPPKETRDDPATECKTQVEFTPDPPATEEDQAEKDDAEKAKTKARRPGLCRQEAQEAPPPPPRVDRAA